MDNSVAKELTGWGNQSCVQSVQVETSDLCHSSGTGIRTGAVSHLC